MRRIGDSHVLRRSAVNGVANVDLLRGNPRTCLSAERVRKPSIFSRFSRAIAEGTGTIPRTREEIRGCQMCGTFHRRRPVLSPSGHRLATNVALKFERAGAGALVLFNRFLQPDIDLQPLAVWPRLELSDSTELLLRLRW